MSRLAILGQGYWRQGFLEVLVFTARCYVLRGLCCRRVSVRPSVCPFVTIRYCNYCNGQYYLNTIEIVMKYLTDYLK